jgi:hypothetical protein
MIQTAINETVSDYKTIENVATWFDSGSLMYSGGNSGFFDNERLITATEKLTKQSVTDDSSEITIGEQLGAYYDENIGADATKDIFTKALADVEANSDDDEI